MTVLENYPPQVAHCNMNLLGTHDTPRVLTALVDDFEGSREEFSKRHLSPEKLLLAKKKLLLASVLQFTLPGAPSVYYGDEAGMEGHKDPFNRRTYPWSKEDSALVSHFRALGQLKKASSALQTGHLDFQAGEGKLGFTRTLGNEIFKIYVNLSSTPWTVSGRNVVLAEGLTDTQLKPMGFCIEKWN